jgi:hypothetical protein
MSASTRCRHHEHPATVQGALREIERLLEAHRVNSPGDKGITFDPIEAVIRVGQRRSGDAQLAAVDSANAMGSVEFDRATSCYGTV